MNTRPYAGDDDFSKLTWILSEARRQDPYAHVIHTGDLNWWKYYILRDVDFRQAVTLWEQDGQAVAWSLLADSEFNLFVHPAHRTAEILAAMLDWIIARNGDGSLSDGLVFERDSLWRDVLESRGFRQVPNRIYHEYGRRLDAIAAPCLPEGFTLRHVTDADSVSRAECHRLAFSANGGRSSMTPERFAAFRNGAPDYQDELDVIAVAPDGTVAAYAQGWLDRSSGVGLFEPVGTHPDYFRRGLGRAVNLEALHRMKAFGATHCIVNADHTNPASNALYQAAGFTVVNRVLTYKREKQP